MKQNQKLDPLHFRSTQNLPQDNAGEGQAHDSDQSGVYLDLDQSTILNFNAIGCKSAISDFIVQSVLCLIILYCDNNIVAADDVQDDIPCSTIVPLCSDNIPDARQEIRAVVSSTSEATVHDTKDSNGTIDKQRHAEGSAGANATIRALADAITQVLITDAELCRKNVLVNVNVNILISNKSFFLNFTYSHKIDANSF